MYNDFDWRAKISMFFTSPRKIENIKIVGELLDLLSNKRSQCGLLSLQFMPLTKRPTAGVCRVEFDKENYGTHIQHMYLDIDKCLTILGPK